MEELMSEDVITKLEKYQKEVDQKREELKNAEDRLKHEQNRVKRLLGYNTSTARLYGNLKNNMGYYVFFIGMILSGLVSSMFGGDIRTVCVIFSVGMLLTMGAVMEINGTD